jgi:hypothetical protein
MSERKYTSSDFSEQVISQRYDDAENWTPQQAAEYAEWLKKVKNKHLHSQKSRNLRVKSRRTADVTGLENDIIAGLRNACQYARMAEQHAEVFDEIGFLYDLEEFINHAKQVSDYIKNYKTLLEI